MNSKLVVLITAMPIDERPVSGVAYYSAELARNLVMRGEHIELWANEDARHDEVLRKNIVRRWKYGHAWYQLIFSLFNERPDLIHIQHSLFLYGANGLGAFAPLIFFFACKFTNTPLIVTLHDVPALRQITNSYVRTHKYNYSPLLVRAALRFLFSSIAAAADHVIIHHAVFRDALVRDYGCPEAKIEIIPHGLFAPTRTTRTLGRVRFHVPTTAYVVGFFGYAAPYKGLESLLRAAECLSIQGDHNTLILIGAGRQPSRHGDREYESYYLDLQRHAKSLNNVRWLGHVPDEDVADFHASCDVMVFPYVAFQGMSGPMSIAATYGIPFLCSKAIGAATGQFEELAVEPTGSSIAEAMTRFRDEPSFRFHVRDCCADFAYKLREPDPRELTARLYASSRVRSAASA